MVPVKTKIKNIKQKKKVGLFGNFDDDQDDKNHDYQFSKDTGHNEEESKTNSESLPTHINVDNTRIMFLQDNYEEDVFWKSYCNIENFQENGGGNSSTGNDSGPSSSGTTLPPPLLASRSSFSVSGITNRIASYFIHRANSYPLDSHDGNRVGSISLISCLFSCFQFSWFYKGMKRLQFQIELNRKAYTVPKEQQFEFWKFRMLNSYQAGLNALYVDLFLFVLSTPVVIAVILQTTYVPLRLLRICMLMNGMHWGVLVHFFLYYLLAYKFGPKESPIRFGYWNLFELWYYIPNVILASRLLVFVFELITQYTLTDSATADSVCFGAYVFVEEFPFAPFPVVLMLQDFSQLLVLCMLPFDWYFLFALSSIECIKMILRILTCLPFLYQDTPTTFLYGVLIQMIHSTIIVAVLATAILDRHVIATFRNVLKQQQANKEKMKLVNMLCEDVKIPTQQLAQSFRTLSGGNTDTSSGSITPLLGSSSGSKRQSCGNPKYYHVLESYKTKVLMRSALLNELVDDLLFLVKVEEDRYVFQCEDLIAVDTLIVSSVNLLQDSLQLPSIMTGPVGADTSTVLPDLTGGIPAFIAKNGLLIQTKLDVIFTSKHCLKLLIYYSTMSLFALLANNDADMLRLLFEVLTKCQILTSQRQSGNASLSSESGASSGTGSHGYTDLFAHKMLEMGVNVDGPLISVRINGIIKGQMYGNQSKVSGSSLSGSGSSSTTTSTVGLTPVEDDDEEVFQCEIVANDVLFQVMTMIKTIDRNKMHQQLNNPGISAANVVSTDKAVWFESSCMICQKLIKTCRGDWTITCRGVRFHCRYQRLQREHDDLSSSQGILQNRPIQVFSSSDASQTSTPIVQQSSNITTVPLQSGPIAPEPSNRPGSASNAIPNSVGNVNQQTKLKESHRKKLIRSILSRNVFIYLTERNAETLLMDIIQRLPGGLEIPIYYQEIFIADLKIFQVAFVQSIDVCRELKEKDFHGLVVLISERLTYLDERDLALFHYGVPLQCPDKSLEEFCSWLLSMMYHSKSQAVLPNNVATHQRGHNGNNSNDPSFIPISSSANGGGGLVNVVVNSQNQRKRHSKSMSSNSSGSSGGVELVATHKSNWDSQRSTDKKPVRHVIAVSSSRTNQALQETFERHAQVTTFDSNEDFDRMSDIAEGSGSGSGKENMRSASEEEKPRKEIHADNHTQEDPLSDLSDEEIVMATGRQGSRNMLQPQSSLRNTSKASNPLLKKKQESFFVKSFRKLNSTFTFLSNDEGNLSSDDAPGKSKKKRDSLGDKVYRLFNLYMDEVPRNRWNSYARWRLVNPSQNLLHHTWINEYAVSYALLSATANFFLGNTGRFYFMAIYISASVMFAVKFVASSLSPVATISHTTSNGIGVRTVHDHSRYYNRYFWLVWYPYVLFDMINFGSAMVGDRYQWHEHNGLMEREAAAKLPPNIRFGDFLNMKFGMFTGREVMLYVVSVTGIIRITAEHMPWPWNIFAAMWKVARVYSLLVRLIGPVIQSSMYFFSLSFLGCIIWIVLGFIYFREHLARKEFTLLYDTIMATDFRERLLLMTRLGISKPLKELHTIQQDFLQDMTRACLRNEVFITRSLQSQVAKMRLNTLISKELAFHLQVTDPKYFVNNSRSSFLSAMKVHLIKPILYRVGAHFEEASYDISLKIFVKLHSALTLVRIDEEVIVALLCHACRLAVRHVQEASHKNLKHRGYHHEIVIIMQPMEAITQAGSNINQRMPSVPHSPKKIHNRAQVFKFTDVRTMVVTVLDTGLISEGSEDRYPKSAHNHVKVEDLSVSSKEGEGAHRVVNDATVMKDHQYLPTVRLAALLRGDYDGDGPDVGVDKNKQQQYRSSSNVVSDQFLSYFQSPLRYTSGHVLQHPRYRSFQRFGIPYLLCPDSHKLQQCFLAEQDQLLLITSHDSMVRAIQNSASSSNEDNVAQKKPSNNGNHQSLSSNSHSKHDEILTLYQKYQAAYGGVLQYLEKNPIDGKHLGLLPGVKGSSTLQSPTSQLEQDRLNHYFYQMNIKAIMSLIKHKKIIRQFVGSVAVLTNSTTINAGTTMINNLPATTSSSTSGTTMSKSKLGSNNGTNSGSGGDGRRWRRYQEQYASAFYSTNGAGNGNISTLRWPQFKIVNLHRRFPEDNRFLTYDCIILDVEMSFVPKQLPGTLVMPSKKTSNGPSLLSPHVDPTDFGIAAAATSSMIDSGTSYDVVDIAHYLRGKGFQGVLVFAHPPSTRLPSWVANSSQGGRGSRSRSRSDDAMADPSMNAATKRIFTLNAYLHAGNLIDHHFALPLKLEDIQHITNLCEERMIEILIGAV